MQRLVTMHMATSNDGRIVAKNWPGPARARFGEICEDVQRALQGDAWIVGRITMAEFGAGEPWPV